MTLALDLALAGLLAATIGCLIGVLRRLATLRAGQAQFVALAGQIGEAAARAEAATTKLRDDAKAADAMLATRFARTQSLKDELMFLVERGERLAPTLAAAREPRPVPTAPAARPAEAPRREQRPLPAAVAGLR